MEENQYKGQIIDAWAQPALVSMVQKLPEIASLFKRSGSGGYARKSLSPEETVDLLDEAGVEKVLLRAWCRPGQWVCTNDQIYEYTNRYPDRFVGIATVDLSKPVEAVKELRRAIKDLGFKGLFVLPWLWQLPPNHKLYYPLYVECIELGIPFCTQVGHTGPLMPSETGRPVPYLDEVALTFPTLKIVGGHLGFPWTDEMIGLCMKHQNVYIDTSAHLPSQYPKQLLDYMKTSGRSKVLFGTNFPHLEFNKCANQAAVLDLPDPSLKRFFYANAKRVFQI
ncbi:amidohydrolase family protein [Leptospira inadai serovar Lyme str. 10]|uniref:Amidohydrolase family protein n=2 Tax=Leptospira inadai serovar Lyme TaxID=293084 RepID=V6HZJ4_9LEPT|nr:amidohydrolase family protein [Leptospira inadai]EQA38434.1 amidohydrolase family protein [Leptospira inadai serovar Lyme str. 10]PNV74212.1 amidohydrolase [Leptospira inadai serovar Lyme]